MVSWQWDVNHFETSPYVLLKKTLINLSVELKFFKLLFKFFYIYIYIYIYCSCVTWEGSA
jgi:hypothetical protein